MIEVDDNWVFKQLFNGIENTPYNEEKYETELFIMKKSMRFKVLFCFVLFADIFLRERAVTFW